MKPRELIGKYGIKQLYHFTDERNIPSIKEHGLLSWKAAQRLGIEVTAPGGNDWSHEVDDKLGLDEYVHLCMIGEHPMEYLARAEGRIGETVFLHLDPSVLEMDGVIFSPGVANKSGVPLLRVAEAVDQMDLDVVYRWLDWRDPEINRRRQEARKYEVLVPDCVPTNLIRNL